MKSLFSTGGEWHKRKHTRKFLKVLIASAYGATGPSELAITIGKIFCVISYV